MPTENIRVVVQGANSQTFSVSANIDPTGTTTVSLPLTGNNSGSDIVQAFLDSKSLSSNQAQVVWQNTNGPISLSPIQVYFQTGYAGAILPAGIGASGFSATQTINSLMINTHPGTYLPGDPDSNGNQYNPMANQAVTSTGTFSANVNIVGDPGGAIYLALVGQFVVAQAGNITFTALSNQGFVLGCPGASYVSGVKTFGGVNQTPIKGYASLAGRNGSFPGGVNYATDNFTLNFPAPGVYNYEIVFASGPYQERQFMLLGPGTAVLPPCTMQTVPQPPAAGNGNLILSPVNAGPDIQGTSQTFTLLISGVKFTSQPYLPIFEGHAATLYISNQDNSNLFKFPALPSGAAVDYTSALAALLSLVGDNAAWQGLVAITTDGNDFKLSFNGGQAAANIASTNLTVSAEDLAWFNSAAKSFDAFSITNQGGGSAVTILVYWLVQPVVASIGPSSLPGDGGTHYLTVNLAKSLPPLQNNIQASFSASGGMTVQSSAVNLDSNNFVTGWTVQVTTPHVGSNTTVSLSLTATGSISYLVGTGEATGTQTYINGGIGSITITGAN